MEAVDMCSEGSIAREHEVRAESIVCHRVKRTKRALCKLQPSWRHLLCGKDSSQKRSCPTVQTADRIYFRQSHEKVSVRGLFINTKVAHLKNEEKRWFFDKVR